jgi:hypothetical protein
MSRRERVVAAIRRVIAAERVLAGVLLAVAVAGAVLIPRLLVGPSPQHALGVGAPNMTGPPVVLAPGLPAQKSQPQAAAGPQSHATHVGVVPSASTSQPAAQPRPATSHAVHGPPPRTQPLPQPQPPAQPDTPPTPHALAPTRLAPKTTTCNGTFSGTGKDVVVPSGATCVLVDGTAITHDLTVSPGGTLIDPAVTVGHDLVAHSPARISIDGGSVGHDLRIEGLSGSAGVQNRVCNTTVGHDLVVVGNANAVAVAGNSVGHDLRIDGAAPTPHAPPPPHPVRTPKPPKPQHEPKPPAPPKPQNRPKPHSGPKPKRHPDLAKPAHVPPPPPKPHPDHPKHPDHAKPQQTPPPEPSHEAEPHGHGNGHKQ